MQKPEPERTGMREEANRPDEKKDSAEESNTLADGAKTVAEERTGVTGKFPLPEIPAHELIRRIGQGSYGEVWLARNVMGTYRAVKIVYRASFEHARPFEREFTGIKKFEPLSRSHDGFVDILQVGRTEDYFYYVMELADDQVTGQQIDSVHYEPKTLRSEVQAHRRLPFEKCTEVGVSLTAALSHLHDHGLIHRDIKPSNIIFVNGLPKLADIGLVAEQSEAKSFVGTEGFIPPEGPGTPQADIYSLGKVLYEIATGKDRHEFPALPTLLGDSTTDTQMLELNTVFLKACQSDLKQRYQTAEQMRSDLLLLQSGKSVKRSHEVERRVRRLTQLSVAGAILTVVTLAAIYVLKSQADREAQLRQRAEAGETKARLNLYAVEMNLARQKIVDGHIFEARALLEAQRPQPGQTDLRGFEWRYLWALCRDESVATLTGHGDFVQCVAISPSGQWLASVGPSERLPKIWETATRQEAKGFAGDVFGLRSVVFSPDGTLLAGGAMNAVLVWDFASRQLLYTLDENGGQVEHVVFSPDGKMLAAGHLNDGKTTLWDLNTRQKLAVLDDLPTDRSSLSFSRDGKTLAVTRGDQTVGLFEVPSLRAVGKLRGHDDQVIFVKFAPDGRTLVSTSADTTAKIWDFATQKELMTFSGHSARVTSANFSPDGQTLATSCMDGTIKLWNVKTGREVTTLKGHSQWVNAVVFFPDGKSLATSSDDKTVKIWDAAPQADRSILAGHANEVKAAAFSTDGKLLATGSADHTVRLWDVASQSEVGVLKGHSSPVTYLGFSPSGERLVSADQDQTVRVWSVRPRRETQTLSQAGWAAGFLNEETLGTGSGELGLILWKKDQNSDLFLRQNQFTNLGQFFVSDQGNLLAKLEAGGIRLMELPSGRESAFLKGQTDGIRQVSFSPDGKTLASIANEQATIRLWSIPNGTCVATLEGHLNKVDTIAFSPDGRLLASGCEDNTVRLWDVDQRRGLAVLRGHSGWVTGLAFSPDGRSLATCSNDGTTKLWSVAAQREVVTLIGHTTHFSHPIFSPDGGALAAFGIGSSKVRLWLAPSLKENGSHAGSNLAISPLP